MTTPHGIDTPERAKAAKIRDRLACEVQHIRGQRNLTPQGRRARLAAAIVKAQGELATLRTDEAQRLAARRDELHGGLFGHVRPDDNRIISIRDAADRAARLTSADEAAALMNRAEETGDTVLLKAVARECAGRSSNVLETGWHELFHQWAAQQPGATEAVEELRVIADEQMDTGHHLARDHAFGIGPLPDDLRGVAVGNLRSLAAGADGEGDVPPSTRGERGEDRLAAMVRGNVG